MSDNPTYLIARFPSTACTAASYLAMVLRHTGKTAALMAKMTAV